MNKKTIYRVARITPLLLLGLCPVAQAQTSAEAGMQVLTRGPVHEAFADAAMEGATYGETTSRMPPAPISELPPDQRPEGANVAWIPGYWGWDDDRTDYIWVSGVWRDLPPGREWVPGYWGAAGQGARWISGYWGDTAQTEVAYLPPPPQSLENGPSSPSPGTTSAWAPGCWVWQQSRYDWQPGYWVVQQPNWVWAPARYTWTPRGSVFVPGYWDHDLVSRGVMFAPVYYEQPIYQQPHYSYSPRVVISIAAVAAFLFIQTRSNHYYYGDYYDHRYEERGFRPWYRQRDDHHGYDHNYQSFRRSQLDHDPNWDTHVNELFERRRDHVDERPPVTLALQLNYFNNRKSGAREDFAIGRDLSEAIKGGTSRGKFRPVGIEERKDLKARTLDVRRFQSERAETERRTNAESSADADAAKRSEPFRVKMRRSPVAARPGEEAGGTPPPAPSTPAPRRVVDGDATPRGPEGRRPAGDRVQESEPSQRARPGRVTPRQASPTTADDEKATRRPERADRESKSPARIQASPERKPRASETQDKPSRYGRGEPKHETSGSEREGREKHRDVKSPERRKKPPVEKQPAIEKPSSSVEPEKKEKSSRYGKKDSRREAAPESGKKRTSDPQRGPKR